VEGRHVVTVHRAGRRRGAARVTQTVDDLAARTLARARRPYPDARARSISDASATFPKAGAAHRGGRAEVLPCVVGLDALRAVIVVAAHLRIVRELAAVPVAIRSRRRRAEASEETQRIEGHRSGVHRGADLLTVDVDLRARAV